MFRNECYSRVVMKEDKTDGEYPVRYVVTRENNFLAVWLDGPDGSILKRRVRIFSDDGEPSYREIADAVTIADELTPEGRAEIDKVLIR